MKHSERVVFGGEKLISSGYVAKKSGGEKSSSEKKRTSTLLAMGTEG